MVVVIGIGSWGFLMKLDFYDTLDQIRSDQMIG